MMGNDLTVTSFTIQNGYGDNINGELRFVKGVPNQPAVIICHSFMAFKDWGFFPYVAEKIARAGCAVLTFNFSLNGVKDDGKKITDFSKFEQNTFSRELHDLGVVVDAVQGNEFKIRELDSGRLIVLGHSRGGGIAIVFASMNQHAKSLVTWSAISTFDRWTNHQKERWKKLGHLPLSRDSAASPLRLGIGLLTELEHEPDRFSILNAAGLLHIPWLLLHGKADVTVNSREAEALYAAANKTQTDLILLDHVGHLYNATTIQQDHYQTLDHIIDLTVHWIQRQLS
jgi:dienelactone hydrolase